MKEYYSEWFSYFLFALCHQIYTHTRVSSQFYRCREEEEEVPYLYLSMSAYELYREENTFCFTTFSFLFSFALISNPSFLILSFFSLSL